MQPQQQHDAYELDLASEPVREGREWVWPSGRRTPVISGASDTGPAPDPGAGAAPVGDTGAEAPAPPADPASGAGTPGAPPAGGPDLQALLNQTREEAKTYRQRAAKFQAFDGIHDDDLAAIGGLAQALKTDPQQALQWMVTNAKAIAGEDGWRALLAEQLAPAPAEKPKLDLTDPDVFNKTVQEQVRAALEQDRQVVTTQQRTEALQKELADAGVQPGTIEWNAVVGHMRENGGSVADAVSHVRGYFETEAQRYARQKAEQAAAAGTPPPAAGAAGAATGEGQRKGPLTMKDGDRALAARLDALGAK